MTNIAIRVGKLIVCSKTIGNIFLIKKMIITKGGRLIIIIV